MSAITQVSPSSSASYNTSSNIIQMSQRDFDSRFGIGKAEQICTDESKRSRVESITSDGIGDSITVFAIEKDQGAIEAIIGLHLSNGSTIENIQEEFAYYFSSDKNYDLYIIGGTEHITQGEGCLLENIYTVLNEFFSDNVHILDELVDLTANTQFNFVSANLQTNGILSYCLHS